jgi:hypothetical protein
MNERLMTIGFGGPIRAPHFGCVYIGWNRVEMIADFILRSAGTLCPTLDQIVDCDVVQTMPACREWGVRARVALTVKDGSAAS